MNRRSNFLLARFRGGCFKPLSHLSKNLLDLLPMLIANKSKLVPEAGFEPARLSAEDSESSSSTNYNTRANIEELYSTILFGGKSGI